ncbi:MAG TPA: CDP-alcohol phosphatidyltransferase family protein [Gemmatimonadaceae bacterium]|jgi:phosphatidylglycerophosphate synthase|nr:CDP-alcohol phosphatidyltransferase family protein [Gemmatimonadaceae bacterium]
MTHLDSAALILAGALVATMPLFAIVARSRPVDPEVARRPASVLLGYWVRDWFMWVIAPIERTLVRWRVSPDLFNYLGAAFGLAAGWAYAVGELSLGAWLVLLGGASDVFDGRIARARGIASPHGAFLDSTLDRFAETFVFVGLAVLFAGRSWLVLAVCAALGGSLLVSYTRARGESLGVQFRGGVMQRAERLVLLALFSLLDAATTKALGCPPRYLLVTAIVIIAIGAMGTAAYRTAMITRELRRSADG